MAGLPHRFGDRTAIADVLAAHEDLEAGGASGAHYRLAWRVLGRRGMGKAAFLDLEDRSGRIQLMATADGLGEQYDVLGV
jgi:lysyl-tRNA synthetase class 2